MVDESQSAQYTTGDYAEKTTSPFIGMALRDCTMMPRFQAAVTRGMASKR